MKLLKKGRGLYPCPCVTLSHREEIAGGKRAGTLRKISQVVKELADGA
jgi:hypothetical protein